MPVLLFDADGVAVRCFSYTNDPKAVQSKNPHLSLDDLAASGAPIGSTRDPETGVIWPFTPPAPTLAELAAGLSLRAAQFWIELQLALVERDALSFQDDVQAHVLLAIETAEAAGAIEPIAAMKARVLVRTATEFLRSDPDNPGLLDAIGALLGLTPAEIDALFLTAVGLAEPEPA